MFTASPSLRAAFATRDARASRASRSAARTSSPRAFWKKAAPEPEPEPEPKKFSLFGGAKTSRAPPEPQYVYEETKGEAYARIRKQRAKRKAEFEAREKGGFASAVWKVTSALDFQEDIEADRGLLRAAKNMKKGDKMDRAQYGALRRKVGGSKSGFFGESVDVKVRALERSLVARRIPRRRRARARLLLFSLSRAHRISNATFSFARAQGKYTDAGYVDQEDDGVPQFAYGSFLGVVVVAVLATTVWVASQVP